MLRDHTFTTLTTELTLIIVEFGVITFRHNGEYTVKKFKDFRQENLQEGGPLIPWIVKAASRKVLPPILSASSRAMTHPKVINTATRFLGIRPETWVGAATGAGVLAKYLSQERKPSPPSRDSLRWRDPTKYPGGTSLKPFGGKGDHKYSSPSRFNVNNNLNSPTPGVVKLPNNGNTMVDNREATKRPPVPR